jgi:hypothetical protein
MTISIVDAVAVAFALLHASWALAVNVVAIRSAASERDLALRSIVKALAILLLEKGRLLKERENSSTKRGEAGLHSNS